MSEGAAARRAILEGELHKAVRAASRKLTVYEIAAALRRVLWTVQHPSEEPPDDEALLRDGGSFAHLSDEELEAECARLRAIVDQTDPAPQAQAENETKGNVMRNRDMPAEIEPMDEATGFTKREAVAMHNMAMLLTTISSGMFSDEALKVRAEWAVKGADALFDELERTAP